MIGLGSLLSALRGDRYWLHERRGSYTFARLICAIFGHTENVYEGGDCRRCWGI